MDNRLKELGQKYGGNFAGTGVAPTPYVSNANLPQPIFNPATNQHFAFDTAGKPTNASKTTAPGQNIFQKFGTVLSQGFHIGERVASKGAEFVVNTAIDIGQAARGVAQTYADIQTQPLQLGAAKRLNEQLDQNQQKIQESYKAGKMSAADYSEALKNLSDARTKINKGLVDPIIAGPTPQQRAGQIVETAVNALTVGKYKPIAAATEGVAKGGLEKGLFDIGKKVENALQTIPSFRELVGRNTQLFVDQSVKQLAGETTSQFLTRNAKNVAIGLLIKRPIVYQTNIGLAQDMYNSILDGHYNQAVKDAAWIGAQAIGGGPLGWFARNTKKYAGKLRQLANGKNSFIDEVSKRIGNGSPAQIADYLYRLKTTSQTKTPGLLSPLAQIALKYKNADDFARETLRRTDLPRTPGQVKYEKLLVRKQDLEAYAVTANQNSPEFKRADEGYKRVVEEIRKVDKRGLLDIVADDPNYNLENNLQKMRDFYDQVWRTSTKSTGSFGQAEKALRIAQEVNLQATGDDAIRAAEFVTIHYDQHGIDLATLTPKQIVEDLSKWAEADEIARKLSPKNDPTEYVAVRWDKAAKNALANRIEQAGDDFKAMTDALSEMASQPGVGWGNNQILMAKIGQTIAQADSATTAAQSIRGISTVATIADNIPPAMAKRLAKLGYSIAEPFGGRKTPKVDFKDTRKLVSAVSNGSGIFDEAIAPQPALNALASLLRKTGVSPESNTKVAYDKLSAALVSNLEDLKVAGELGLGGDDPARGGKFILSRLQEYINKQAPNPYLNVGTLGRGNQSALQDVRQMNVKEIMEALPGTTKDVAKKLQQAILKSYTDVPLEFRGLGIKASDYAYRIPGAKTYYRIQSALRYVYNPFFRAQEVIETKLLSHMKANNLLWMKPKAELDRVSKVLDESGVFTTGYTGEATQDLTVGRIHANLLKTQQRDLAGLALDIAEKKGVTVEQLVRDNPDELADALRVIVQYPTKGILNSPLARTLNIAFFPMRYNLKVAGLVAKEVSKLPPTVQTAFIHSMFKMSSWLKSPEGIQWQSDNADAIQLFSYFTPIQNVASVLNLLHGRPDSFGSLGLLGGLPFGAISQILDAEGIVHMNTPYVNPKTGDVMPDYIPQTTKARAAVALEGLLNSMFSYPGRVIGLPGKGEFLRNQVKLFLKTGNGDYLNQIRTEDLTPLQLKWIDTLSNPNVTQDQIDQLYVSPAPGQFNWYTLPPMNLPEPKKVLTRTEVLQAKQARSSAPSGKKKALPIPERGQQL